MQNKKLIIALISAVCVLSIVVLTLFFVHANSHKVKLLNVFKNNKLGFIDRKGKVVVPYKYQILGQVQEGLAVACENFKCGFIDKKGNVKIKFEYDEAYSFVNGLAVVRKDDKCGFINKKGKLVIPMDYISADNFTQGKAPVCRDIGQCGYVNKLNMEVIPFEYDKVTSFVNGVANVEKDGNWGAINTRGKIVIPIDYEALGVLAGDKISACKIMPNINNAIRCGYIDKKGNEVLPFKYIWTVDFSEGIGAVQGSDTRWYYIDENGENIFGKSYSIASGFSEGLAEICVNPTTCGFTDKYGEPVISVKYSATSSFKDGIAAVLLNNKWGFIDKRGKTVIPFEFDWTGLVF